MDSRSGHGSYVFTCRDCGAEIIVDDETLEELLDFCCVVCGADVSRDSFEPRPQD